MMQVGLFWRLEGVSNEALLGGLDRLVGSGRRVLAELVAHLAEVEERRLHLDAGYSSLFAYCTSRLGMSEDEAYRRIAVARLGRRMPVILQHLATGALSLSVAALLKPYQGAPNLDQLVRALLGRSVNAARDVLAAHFPAPDVPSTVRQMPQRRNMAASSRPELEPVLAARLPEPDVPSTVRQMPQRPDTLAARFPEPDVPSTLWQMPQRRDMAAASMPEPEPPSERLQAQPRAQSSVAPQRPMPTTAQRPTRPIEPLSETRYKIQFTAGATLKEKLELARDLLRHSVPSGDFAALLERALDLLIADHMKRRFGAQTTRKRAKPSHRSTTADATTNTTVSRATRRSVLERDGLCCTWQGDDGVRCGARAWLERDHRCPRARGGPSTVENVRHLCRVHNRRAAELAFGEEYVASAIAQARERRGRPRTVESG